MPLTIFCKLYAKVFLFRFINYNTITYTGTSSKNFNRFQAYRLELVGVHAHIKLAAAVCPVLQIVT